MLVAVIGANGALGRQVLPRLAERGHQVRGVVRREALLPWVAAQGAEPARADILDPPSLAPVLAGCEAVLNLATAVPRPGAAPAWEANDRVRRDGTRHLIAACLAVGTLCLIQQSVAHIMRCADDAMANEDDPVHAPPNLVSALAMEQAVRGAPLGWLILRGGAFYGPGTGRYAAWRDEASAGCLRLPGDGSGWVSPIHVSDMASAVVAALEAGVRRTTLAVVDDEPVRYRDLLGHVARLEGAAVPTPGGPMAPSFRVSNRRLRVACGWRPLFATYRSGLADAEPTAA